MTAVGPGDVSAARRAAQSAARVAGVTVRELVSIGELNAAAELLGVIWGRPDKPPMPPELMRALSTSGSYVSGAFDGDELVGVTVGFHSSPERRTLHSHIAGTAPAAAGRSIGFAMKIDERAWALERGIRTIEWTFDPLVARNAHFNINKLAALPVEYLPDFYGAMPGRINAGDVTDRMLIEWPLLDPRVVTAADAGGTRPIGSSSGPPSASPSARVSVAVPPDIEGLRLSDPAAARQWRLKLRSELTTLLDAGGRIVGFDRATGYVVQPGEFDGSAARTEGEER